MDEHSRLIERLLDDQRSFATDIKTLSVQTARHEEILKDRAQVLEQSLERLTMLEVEQKELTRRTDAHGRKTDILEQTVRVMKADLEKPVIDITQKSWKDNLPLVAMLVVASLAAMVVFLSFGGDPGELLETVPGL